jgi:hypothetical protein
MEARSLAIPVSSQSSEAATRVWLVLWKAAPAIEQNAIRSVCALGLGHSDFAVVEVLLHKGLQPSVQLVDDLTSENPRTVRASLFKEFLLMLSALHPRQSLRPPLNARPCRAFHAA